MCYHACSHRIDVFPGCSRRWRRHRWTWTSWTHSKTTKQPWQDHRSVQSQLLLFDCFSLYFQGENGSPGKPGPSGDPVRLLKAISLFIISGNMWHLYLRCVFLLPRSYMCITCLIASLGDQSWARRKGRLGIQGGPGEFDSSSSLFTTGQTSQWCHSLIAGTSRTSR